MQGTLTTVKRRVLLVSLVVIGLALLGVSIYARRRCRVLYCVAPAGVASVECTDATTRQTIRKIRLTDPRELVIQEVAVTRDHDTARLRITLQGHFDNEQDQNIYVFIGEENAAGASYSLSSDTQYFKDVAYPVRNTIQFSHRNEIRLGVMSPEISNYTPQVYIHDPVYADLVGNLTNVRLVSSGNEVSLGIPLADYYQRLGKPVPGSVSFTVASARDYVGFIDEITVNNVAEKETKRETKKTEPPSLYPPLNYDSHIFKRVTIEHSTTGAARIRFTTNAEIQDWAQTDLHFFFVPYPLPPSVRGLSDPSHSLNLPVAWSYYCGVYSPNRIFCKASNGSDFTYDSGYAKRTELALPAGVTFQTLGNAEYSLELEPQIVSLFKGQNDQFALLMTAGRDGFAPTSAWGWDCSRLCSALNGLLPF
jgi:hypothetical protein